MFEFDNLPEDLSSLSGEDLQGYENTAVQEFNSLRENTDVTAENVARMEALVEGIANIRAELSARVTSANEAAARLAELSSRFDSLQPVPEPVVVVNHPGVPDATPTPPPDSAPESDSAPVVPTVAPEVTRVQEVTQPISIIASADIPGVSAGSELSLSALAEAMHKKARTLSDHSGMIPIATIEKTFEDGYDLTTLSREDAWDAICDLANGNSLTASGGWCAPSEIIYSFFDLECARGSVLQLPTFRADRGGVTWPISSPLPTSTIDWIHTEANDIAGNVKPCITIPCPTFRECRLAAHGVCVTAGNLMDRAYPENVQRYIRQVFLAHERNENLYKLAQLVAGSSLAAISGTFAAASATLGAVMLQVADYRDKFRMCDGATLEAVFPIWVRDVFRIDIARQQGTLNGQGRLPTNADMDAWFRAMGVSAQFVNDWQPIVTEATPGNPAPKWPPNVSFLLYAPGTWVQFDQGTLDLGVTRDSVLNSTNDFTAAWTEDFYCIGLRGYESRYVTVPICPSGAIGAYALEQCEGQIES